MAIYMALVFIDGNNTTLLYVAWNSNNENLSIWMPTLIFKSWTNSNVQHLKTAQHGQSQSEWNWILFLKILWSEVLKGEGDKFFVDNDHQGL